MATLTQTDAHAVEQGSDFEALQNTQELVPTYMADHLVVADVFDTLQGQEQASSLTKALHSQDFLVNGDQLVLASLARPDMTASEFLKIHRSIREMAGAVLDRGGMQVSAIYPEGYNVGDCATRESSLQPRKFVPKAPGLEIADINASRQVGIDFGWMLEVLEKRENPFDNEEHDRLRIILLGFSALNQRIKRELTPQPPILKLVD